MVASVCGCFRNEKIKPEPKEFQESEVEIHLPEVVYISKTGKTYHTSDKCKSSASRDSAHVLCKDCKHNHRKKVE